MQGAAITQLVAESTEEVAPDNGGQIQPVGGRRRPAQTPTESSRIAARTQPVGQSQQGLPRVPVAQPHQVRLVRKQRAGQHRTLGHEAIDVLGIGPTEVEGAGVHW